MMSEDNEVSQFKDDAVAALKELNLAIFNFNMTASKISSLLTNGAFKHLSKLTRNNMLSQMIEQADHVEMLTKVSYRKLKKVKREKIKEHDLDILLGVSNRDIPTVENNDEVE